MRGSTPTSQEMGRISSRAPSVGADVALQDAAADGVAHYGLESVGDYPVGVGVGQLFGHFVAQGVFAGFQGDFVQVFLQGVGEAGADDFADAVVQLLRRILVAFDCGFRLAGAGGQFLDEFDDLAVGFLGAADGFQDDLLGGFVAAGFDHNDGFAGAADDHAEGAVVAFLVGGVDEVLAVAVGDAAGADGAVEGDGGDGEGGGGADHSQDFRRVFLVGG